MFCRFCLKICDHQSMAQRAQSQQWAEPPSFPTGFLKRGRKMLMFSTGKPELCWCFPLVNMLMIQKHCFANKGWTVLISSKFWKRHHRRDLLMGAHRKEHHRPSFKHFKDSAKVTNVYPMSYQIPYDLVFHTTIQTYEQCPKSLSHSIIIRVGYLDPSIGLLWYPIHWVV